MNECSARKLFSYVSRITLQGKQLKSSVDHRSLADNDWKNQNVKK